MITKIKLVNIFIISHRYLCVCVCVSGETHLSLRSLYDNIPAELPFLVGHCAQSYYCPYLFYSGLVGSIVLAVADNFCSWSDITKGLTQNVKKIG